MHFSVFGIIGPVLFIFDFRRVKQLRGILAHCAFIVQEWLELLVFNLDLSSSPIRGFLVYCCNCCHWISHVPHFLTKSLHIVWRRLHKRLSSRGISLVRNFIAPRCQDRKDPIHLLRIGDVDISHVPVGDVGSNNLPCSDILEFVFVGGRKFDIAGDEFFGVGFGLIACDDVKIRLG